MLVLPAMSWPRFSDALRPRNGLGRVRWILPPVIGTDTLMTLLGQPDTFWTQPGSAVEYNDFFAWFLVRGPVFFTWTSLLYIVGAVLFASLLPRRIALAATLAYVLGHYGGATSWMLYRFGCGMWVAVCYAAVIGLALVALGADVRPRGTPPTR